MGRNIYICMYTIDFTHYSIPIKQTKDVDLEKIFVSRIHNFWGGQFMLGKQ